MNNYPPYLRVRDPSIPRDLRRDSRPSARPSPPRNFLPRVIKCLSATFKNVPLSLSLWGILLSRRNLLFSNILTVRIKSQLTFIQKYYSLSETKIYFNSSFIIFILNFIIQRQQSYLVNNAQ